jgi:peptidoglycan hydrolase CwlO-like protein
MALSIEVHHYLHFDAGQLSGIEASLVSLTRKVTAMANDVTGLDAKLDELKAKSDESNATLAGLAQAVVDLKNAADIQPAIDALTAKAQAILDGMTAAEDAADDQLPGA